MILIALRYLVPRGYNGITIYPFVFLRHKADVRNKILLNHERIHLRQQLELAIVFFFIVYALNYLVGIIKYRNHFQAYRNIVFEREAYANEKDLNYLKKRSFWRFLMY